MVYENRDRGRVDRESEFRGGEYRRRTFSRDDDESRWPGESSWGYGREYDEGYPERPHYGEPRAFEGGGRPEITRGATEFHPATIRRYRETHGAGFGWQPEGGYGQGAGYLYGWSPGEQGFESRAYRTPERWRTEPYGTRELWRTSRYLPRIPRGPFTGRGPKGYQRSDERIREDVSEDLALAGDIDASEIEVRVNNCIVTLEGEVQTREEKRFAEDIAEAAPGVRDVHNNLRLTPGVLERLSEEEKAYSAPKSR
jgi:osmotically-inducible protein OsmY